MFLHTIKEPINGQIVMQVVDGSKLGSEEQITRDVLRDVYRCSGHSVYAVGASWVDGKCEDYYYDGDEEISFSYECPVRPDYDTFIDSYRRVEGVDTRCEQNRDAHLDRLVLSVSSAAMSLKGRVFDVDNVQGHIPSVYSTQWDFDTCQKICFKEMDSIGFYPIVSDEHWFKLVSCCGVKTIQLRIKDRAPYDIERMIDLCSDIAEKHDVRFIVNDYWQFALKYPVYGVHLGQEDIQRADLRGLSNAGLRLGISTHCYHELARARFFKPSYVALGPIYGTTSKHMKFRAQGVDMLRRWVTNSTCPIVAIGGISLSNIHDVINCGVDGCAVISAVTEAQDPVSAIAEFLSVCSNAKLSST